MIFFSPSPVFRSLVMQDVGCIQMGGQAALIAQLSPLCPAKALFSFNYLSILKRCQTKRSWQGLALREQCGGCKEGAYSRELLQEGWMSCSGWLLRLVRRHRGGSLWQDFRTEPVPCAPSAPSGSERLVLCTDTPRQTVPQERRCSARPHHPATDTPAQPQQRGREPSPWAASVSPRSRGCCRLPHHGVLFPRHREGAEVALLLGQFRKATSFVLEIL